MAPRLLVGGLWGTPSRPATEPPVRVTCADEVELFVALGKDVHVVGRVLARAPMTVVDDDSERTRVAFERSVLDAAERATGFVDEWRPPAVHVASTRSDALVVHPARGWTTASRTDAIGARNAHRGS